MLPNLKSIDFFVSDELEDSDNESDLEVGINSAVVSSSPGASGTNKLENPFIAALKNNKITKMEDSRNFNVARLLLSNGLCPGLVSLTLGMPFTDHDGDILSILKDLPVLKHLAIDFFHLSIDMLETVHNNIPSLESLDLRDITITPCIFPANISPTALVYRLKLDVDEMYDEYAAAEWIRYTSLKYTNLTYFYHKFITCSAYKELMAVLVRNCGTSLTPLAFNSSVDEDCSVMRSIDTHFIKELEIWFLEEALTYPFLEQTRHFIHLKKLKLHDISPTRKLDKLKDIVGLESLEINFLNMDYLCEDVEYKGYQLDIFELFKSFPESLESVTIEAMQLTFDYKYVIKFHQTKILSLCATCLKTPQIRFIHFKMFVQPETLIYGCNIQPNTPIFNTQPPFILFGNLTIPVLRSI